MTGWRRSTFCGDSSCVEVQFQRSTFCGETSCVEVHRGDEFVHVRDSKTPTTWLRFDLAEWQAFTDGVKAGEFDL